MNRLFAVTAVTFTLWLCRIALAPTLDNRFHRPLLLLVSASINAVFLLLPYAIFARSDFIRLISCIKSPVRRLAAVGVIILAYLVYLLGMLYLTGPSRAVAVLESHLVLPTVLLIAVNVLVEEAFARGILLPGLQVRFSFWAANLVSTAIFVAFHIPSWLWFKMPAHTLGKEAVIVAIMSLVSGYLFKLSKSIWPSTVLHTLHNVVLLPVM